VLLPVRNVEGQEVGSIEVEDYVFAIRPHRAVLHQAYVAQRANQRRGTHSTKTRGEVRGSTRKTRPQKYTGRARQGSIRAPHRKGGGVVFGPKPRDYSQRLPKKMRRLALRSALSAKAAEGELIVLDRLELERPSTKEMARILHNLGVDRSALVVTGEPDRTVFLSVRNLQRKKCLPAAYLNVVDLLHHRYLVMTEAAVRKAEELWGEARDRERALRR
jgi:large subunit ribosomal protein L4